jgi:hypothetical protein
VGRFRGCDSRHKMFDLGPPFAVASKVPMAELSLTSPSLAKKDWQSTCPNPSTHRVARKLRARIHGPQERSGRVARYLHASSGRIPFRRGGPGRGAAPP